jgi:hypothetical protein
VNCSWKSTSTPFSFCRVKTIPKRPEEVAQRYASTDRTAVHFRSIIGGCIGEKRTSLNAKAGLHVCWPAACVAPISPTASSPNMHDRYMWCSPSNLIRDDHLFGGVAGSFTLYIAAAVSAAYVQNPPAMAAKKPIAPRSSP